MSRQDDSIVEQEIREYWWSMGEAVMREMMEVKDGEDSEAV